jgi:magnesium transporter
MAPQRRIDVVLDSVKRLLRIGATANLLNLLQKQHPADLAQVFGSLLDTERQAVFSLLVDRSGRLAMETVSEMGPEEGAKLLTGRSAEEIARLLQEIPSDDAAALIDYLPEELSTEVLELMRRRESGQVESLLEYGEQTAGRIMNPQVFALSEDLTVGEAITALQSSRDVEMVFYLYVVDARRHLVGVTSLRRLLLVSPETPLKRIMTPEVTSVRVDTDQEEVARQVASYNLLAVPVVDEENKLVGIVTVDDVIDALVSESTEDVQKFGGMQAIDEPYTRIGIAKMVRKRVGWLAVLFVGEMLTETAMRGFEHAIDQAVVLALFIPLIISSGGNSGSQATSLMIRALALREVALRDWWRVALRELPTGLALGIVLGAVGMLRILIWQATGWGDYGEHYRLVALTIGLSLVGVVLFGSLTGSMLPFLLRRVGADPASASAPFVATLVDVTGVVIYFSVALALLRGTLL